MTISLGLDIGTNSVGSAWVNTGKREITVGVSIFPAGVDQSKDRRGAPKNQDRRQKRSQRRTLRRRAERKRRLREVLTDNGLLPAAKEELRRIFGPCKNESEKEEFALEQDWNPWHLRRESLSRKLELYEFGRVLVHINQRRGSAEIKLDEQEQRKELENVSDEEHDSPDDDEKKRRDERKKATAAAKRTAQQLGGKTFGQWMADEYDKRRVRESGNEGTVVEYRDPIRNRRDTLVEANDKAILANRELIRREFDAIWEHQKSYDGELGRLLTSAAGEKLRLALNDPNLEADDKKHKSIWREAGTIFEQRKTYWNAGTLGRCDLEPTDRCIFKIDMYAQQFRVIETVNNISITELGRKRSLTQEERDTLINYLSTPQTTTNKKTRKQEPQATVKVDDVRVQLRIDKESLNAQGIPDGATESSLDNLGDRDINDDWFSRKIVHGVFNNSKWQGLEASAQDEVNRELLRFDPESDRHRANMKRAATEMWNLDEDAANLLVQAACDRPTMDRMNLSRRAIQNLLPYMRDAFTDRDRDKNQPVRIYWLNEHKFDATHHRWLTEIEARQAFAENADATDQTNGKLVRELVRKQKEKEHGKDKEWNVFVGHEVRMRYAHTVTNTLRKLVLSELRDDEEKLRRAERLRGLRKRDLHYQRRHPEQIIPPAPQMSNPVVRKAIHVVREHIVEHLRNHRHPETGEIVFPDQIVIELAREIRQTAKVRDAVQKRNDNRNAIRKAIAEKWKDITKGNPRHPAVERVLLCRQQNFTCPYSGLPKGKLNPPEDGICVYSGKTISEQQAATGEGLEVDHIVPRSRGGDNGLNNKVLCFVEANRRKANQTPKQSLSDDEFKGLERFMRHLAKRPFDGDYFTKKDYKRKWDNLHSEAKPSDFRESQLGETAYAAVEVGRYLRAALFPNEPHRVVFTKGGYTDVLRKDWRLMQRLPDPWRDDLTTDERDERRKRLSKDRNDHRHHAVDAVIIALTVNQRDWNEDYLEDLKHELEAREEQLQQLRENNLALAENSPKRMPLLPPWPYVQNSADAAERSRAWQTFRRDVLSKVFSEFDALRSRDKGDGTETGQPLIVSHRPQRRIYGSFHEDTPYGEAAEYKGLYVTRKSISELKPGHFIEPRQERDGSWKIPGQGQGQAIRDASLREDLRICLVSGKVRVTADDFQKKSQLKSLVECGCLVPAPDLSQRWDAIKQWLNETRPKLIVNLDQKWTTDAQKRTFTNAAKIIDRHDGFQTRSGVPIRSVRLLLALSNPIPIEKFDQHQNGTVTRYFKGGNNHHFVVYEDTMSGKWVGQVVSMNEAVKRNRERLIVLATELRLAGIPPLHVLRQDKKLHQQFKQPISKISSSVNERYPVVERSGGPGRVFRMSLCIGEMMYLKDKDSGMPGFFRVSQVNKTGNNQSQQKVFVVPHEDARPKKRKGIENYRLEHDLTAATIQRLIVHPGEIKCRVDALGGISWIHD